MRTRFTGRSMTQGGVGMHWGPELARRRALEVACVRSESRTIEAASIALVLPDGVTPESVLPSSHDRRADDVETRLRVRVLGLNAEGNVVGAELLAMRRVTLSGDMDPTQPASGCCDEMEPGDPQPAPPPPPPHPGFDFESWSTHVGTRQLCVIVRVQPPERARPEDRLPPEIPVSMWVTCQHAAGTSHLRLLFDQRHVSAALYIDRGMFVRGVITDPRGLVVEGFSQTPDQYRRTIRP